MSARCHLNFSTISMLMRLLALAFILMVNPPSLADPDDSYEESGTGSYVSSDPATADPGKEEEGVHPLGACMQENDSIKVLKKSVGGLRPCFKDVSDLGKGLLVALVLVATEEKTCISPFFGKKKVTDFMSFRIVFSLL